MCNNNNCDRNGLSTLITVVSGIVLVAAAVSAAVYFILKFIEKKEKCDYIECDCYGDYDGYDDCEDEAPAAEVKSESTADKAE